MTMKIAPESAKTKKPVRVPPRPVSNKQNFWNGNSVPHHPQSVKPVALGFDWCGQSGLSGRVTRTAVQPANSRLCKFCDLETCPRHPEEVRTSGQGANHGSFMSIGGEPVCRFGFTHMNCRRFWCEFRKHCCLDPVEVQVLARIDLEMLVAHQRRTQ